jgi:hypothetical protein
MCTQPWQAMLAFTVLHLGLRRSTLAHTASAMSADQRTLPLLEVC